MEYKDLPLDHFGDVNEMIKVKHEIQRFAVKVLIRFDHFGDVNEMIQELNMVIQFAVRVLIRFDHFGDVNEMIQELKHGNTRICCEVL